MKRKICDGEKVWKKFLIDKNSQEERTLCPCLFLSSTSSTSTLGKLIDNFLGVYLFVDLFSLSLKLICFEAISVAVW